MLAKPSIATGVFVYQSFIISSKNWGPYVIAQSFMAYSILSVITLSISGFLIDTYSSRRILIYIPDPEFRRKESNNHLISHKVEQLKRQIRRLKSQRHVSHSPARTTCHQGQYHELHLRP